MASFLIHLCVCEEINKKLKKNREKMLIGSIAPDIAKLIGIDRNITHFGEHPNLDLFLSKYKNNISDDFVLGYFIHLYTDYLWDKYLVNKIYKDGMLTMVNGKKTKCDNIGEYLYKDYDSLNADIINTYNMNLSFLSEKLPEMHNIIDEVSIDKLNIVVDKTNELLSKNIKDKLYVLDMDLINEFIFLCKKKIINKIDKIV